MEVWIGVDVGGTNTVCGAVDETGRILSKLSAPTEKGGGLTALFDQIADMAHACLAEVGSPDAKIAGAGIGVPGLVDSDKGIAVISTNLGWRNAPFAAEVSRRLRVPVRIDNDVRSYVYGEAFYGAGRGCRSMLGLTVGTGIAAAIVSEGRLVRGYRGMAGEIGHGPREGLSARCACGLVGCLETVASASGMVREARRELAAGRRSLLSEWYPDERKNEMTAADLSKAIDAGDELAADILRSAGTHLALALESAIYLLGPEVIIIGGGGARAGERLLGPIRSTLLERLLPEYAQSLSIVRAELDDGAGIIGSAMQARNGA